MKIKKKVLIVLILIAFSSIYSVIFLRNAQVINTTGDLSFHLSRIKGLSSIFSGPINYKTFNYYGSGVNYFYPYITIFPAVILYWITKNLILSYVLYVLGLNISTILIAYYYGKKFLKRNDAAFLFSCLYTCYGYRSIDIYFRSALAEAVALTLILPVLYYSYEIIFKNKDSSIYLALSMSLLIYTHVLSTLMCTIFIVVCIISKFIFERKIHSFTQALFYMLKGAGMTVTLTIFFWYPMLRQTFYQTVNEPFSTILQMQAQNCFTSLQGALDNDLTSYSMGFIGLISLIFPLFVFKKLTSKERIVYGISFVLWYMSTSLFPWFIFQKTLIRLIQFPWRVLGLQAVFGSLILAIVFNKTVTAKKNSMQKIIVFIIMFMTINVAAKENFSKKIESIRGNIEINKDTLDYYTNEGTGGLYDYAPINALKYKEHLIKHEVRINKTWQKAQFKATDSKITYIVNSSSKGQKITLPVYVYWGTHMKLNEKEVSELINTQGLVSVESNKGVNKIQIYLF